MSQPNLQDSDAVLGGKSLLSVHAAVLGGAAGEKQKLAHELGLSNELAAELIQTHDIFSFETVTVNDRGEIVTRSTKQAFHYTENLGDGVILDMVYIPAGSFMMGSSEGEEGNKESEKPRHLVHIPAFYMGKYPVTQEQYQLITGKKSSKLEEDKLPIENVSWDDSQKFCEKVSQKVGRKYQFPSESQWEYACRAGTTTLFNIGNTITPELANIPLQKPGEAYSKTKHKKYRTIVGSFPANNFGLYDMHGNVCEWCEDFVHIDYHGAPIDGSAWIKDIDIRHVARGGGSGHLPHYCRSAKRLWFPMYKIKSVGFRVVHT